MIGEVVVVEVRGLRLISCAALVASGPDHFATAAAISADWGSAAGLVQGTYLVGLDPESWATPRTVRSLGDLPSSLVVAVRPA